MKVFFFFLRTLSRVIGLLPRRARMGLGDLIGWFLGRVIRFRRSVVVENIRTAYGNELSESERAYLVRKNYAHYGRVFVEVIESIVWTPGDCARNIKVSGVSNIDAVMRSGRGGIFLTSHLGNWELSIVGAASRGIPLDVVVKRPRTRLGEEFLGWYRQRTGARVIPESGSARDILRSISRGRFVAFILDQFMGPPIGLPVKFFGHPAGTAAALALMTEKRDIAIIPVRSFRDSRGVLHTVFEKELSMPPLPEERNLRLFEKTQFFNDVLERHVRSQPDQWMWLHRRWKSYKGTPRWQPEKALLVTWIGLLTLLLGACSSLEKTSPTGIALPSDPDILVPEFQAKENAAGDVEEESAEVEEAEVAVAVDPQPTVVEKKEKTKPIKKKVVTAAKKTKKPVDGKVVSIVKPEHIPFEIGEQMEIELNWMALPAGKATLEVREGPQFNGRPTFHLWGHVLSSKLVDAIYHIDNTIESYIDRQGLIPYKFKIGMVESAQIKETRVSFDHPNLRAYYWAKRISQRWGDENIDRQDTIVPQARDMFSALYYARTLSYKPGSVTKYPLYENKQNFEVEATPVGTEMLNTKVGVFQCLKLKVLVRVNNVLKQTGDIFLWLSDDSKKYIVKFDAKLKIGSLYGNLVGLRERK